MLVAAEELQWIVCSAYPPEGGLLGKQQDNAGKMEMANPIRTILNSPTRNDEMEQDGWLLFACQ